LSFVNQGGTRTIYNSQGNPIGTETTNNFEFEEGIKQIFSIGLKLDLLKQNGAAQILSEPSILCTNNKESTIYVGKTNLLFKTLNRRHFQRERLPNYLLITIIRLRKEGLLGNYFLKRV